MEEMSLNPRSDATEGVVPESPRRQRDIMQEMMDSSSVPQLIGSEAPAAITVLRPMRGGQGPALQHPVQEKRKPQTYCTSRRTGCVGCSLGEDVSATGKDHKGMRIQSFKCS